ncbi:glutathione peroxidase [Paenibacillus sp. GCM10023248]|uniref:glutathione peroxidase n=1 Tax=Bacillales TaxID=1385 RepID=UPI00237940AB|nr:MULTISPECIES: glutathione peroxidase [Bacillales]MDD9268256.1 glutathione peroxidase [Paenibacillus sp. MAHUQ-63]MDR6879934.1 glutathione peroxidase [Bacillus sp. 3255]
MSIYQFTAQKPNGEQLSLENYAGKYLLIVNTASKCQFTSQFDELQKMYDRYQTDGFEIIGFPCNQFAEQEPGTSEEAESFCRINYGVKFQMFAKVNVNGEDAAPLFQYLKQTAPFQGFDPENIQAKLLKLVITEKHPEWLFGDSVKWNFTKFLIDRNGQVLKRYEPTYDMERMNWDIKFLTKFGKLQ